MNGQSGLQSRSPQPTGRQLIFFKPQSDLPTVKQLFQKNVGIEAVDSLRFGGNVEAIGSALTQGHAVYIDRFKVAAVEATRVGVNLATLQAEESVVQIRPEFYMFAIGELQQRSAAWVQEGLKILAEGVTGGLDSTRPLATARALATDIGLSGAPFADTNEFTWGLAAVGAHRSTFSGHAIRVAVLDTGLDLNHPDFSGRVIETKSFVASETIDDIQGHGTHTAGTIAGPKVSHVGRRYGVAPSVEFYVGKVLDNRGTGREADILEGINWAIENKCVAISMSLGRAVAVGERPDPLYEEVGAAALREGSLIIAAAGNDSSRDFGYIAPVGAPANSPSIMAVAAADPTLKVAPFSDGGINRDGGEVNVCAPGVSVYSSFPRPQLSRVLQGTSMACPHVAGIAALWAESDPTLRGEKLWKALERSARDLGSNRDYGRGLVAAPGSGFSA